MYRHFVFTLILPMILYYLSLGFFPQFMADHLLFGWPLSLLFGVMVMIWGVVVALLFAYQESQKSKMRDR